MKTLNTIKPVFVLGLLILLPAFSLSALPEFTLSGGSGINLGGLFTNYIINADENTKYGYADIVMTQEIQQFNFGAFIFFDATYGELAITIQHGLNAYKEDVDARGHLTLITTREGTGSETMLGFTLLTKYPFQLRESLVVYPLLGVEYQIALAEKRKDNVLGEHDRIDGITEFPGDDFTLSLWNSWFIRAGAGLNFYFRSSWYLKTEFLYSFRLMTPYEKAAVDYLQDDFGISYPKLFGNPGMRGLTHGPELRIGIGYRFM